MSKASDRITEAKIAVARARLNVALARAEQANEIAKELATLRAENARLRKHLEHSTEWMHHFLHYQYQPSAGNPNWDKLQSDYAEIRAVLETTKCP